MLLLFAIRVVDFLEAFFVRRCSRCQIICHLIPRTIKRPITRTNTQFAVDTKISETQWMYGGRAPSDENALRVAGNELRVSHQRVVLFCSLIRQIVSDVEFQLRFDVAGPNIVLQVRHPGAVRAVDGAHRLSWLSTHCSVGTNTDCSSPRLLLSITLVRRKVLPINSPDTLRYGSDDGGQSVSC